MRLAPLVNNFTAGEWSPELYARADLARYNNACRRAENAIVLPEGPITRRPGLRMVARTKSDGAARLIGFEYSTDQTYMLEFGAAYVRIFTTGGPVLSAGVPVEVVTPYSAGELAAISQFQSADILYLCHPEHGVRELQRSAPTSWALASYAPQDGPYLHVNTGAVTLTPSAATGAITLTASAALFAATDVGRSVRLKPASAWGWCTITSYTSPTVVGATVQASLGGTSATTSWRLGAWSDTTGYPTCGCFFGGRAWFGGTRSQPQTLWGSVAGDFASHAPTAADGTVNDDNGIVITIDDDQVNAITWLLPDQVLLIGTQGGVFALSAGDSSGVVTPDNASVKRRSPRACAAIRAARADTYPVFVQRHGQRLREWRYDFGSDSYLTPDLSVLAAHIARRGIAEIAWHQEPWSVLWCRLDDGGLAGLTDVRDQEVIAWHRHPLDGAVESLATKAGPDGDELWVVIARTIGAGTVRTIERLDPRAFPIDAADKDDLFFVDGGVTYDGAATTTVTGLAHLEGRTVQILADGAVQPDRVVAGGAVTLDRAASVVQAGLGYLTAIETMTLEPPAPDGTSAGRRKRISRATIQLYQSLGMSVGTADGPIDDVPFRRAGDVMGASPPLFTGDIKVPFGDGFGTRKSVVVEQVLPLPLTVLAIMPALTVEGG